MKTAYIFPVIFLVQLFSCSGQDVQNSTEIKERNLAEISVNEDSLEIMNFYSLNKGNELPSNCTGSVSAGKLENGKLVPFYGSNYTYFSKESYLASRAFTSDSVLSIILEAYNRLGQEFPNRHFYLMELSNKEGGSIYPHRTHQNGLSADFMMPKTKEGKPFYGLDTLGKEHYFLEFNDNGEYKEDTTIRVDFDLIVKHILILNSVAMTKGYRISKVIIKVEYKDELFASQYGDELKSSGIYLVRDLTPLINGIHDDHFHIDFEEL